MHGAVDLSRPGMKRAANGGVLLDAKGRPEFDAPFDKPGLLFHYFATDLPELDVEALPESIRKNLEKSREYAGIKAPRASGLGWEEMMYSPVSDGAAVTAAAETIMVPDFSVPAGYMTVGRLLKYTLIGRQSTAITTPGTITLRLRWGGVGGVSVAASGAFAPDSTAAATNLTWMVEWWVQCRTVGTTGTFIGAGRIEWSDYDDASAAALVGNLNMRMAPTSAPATASVDTTIDKLISPTYQESAATGSMTTHIAFLESVN